MIWNVKVSMFWMIKEYACFGLSRNLSSDEQEMSIVDMDVGHAGRVVGRDVGLGQRHSSTGQASASQSIAQESTGNREHKANTLRFLEQRIRGQFADMQRDGGYGECRRPSE